MELEDLRGERQRHLEHGDDRADIDRLTRHAERQATDFEQKIVGLDLVETIVAVPLIVFFGWLAARSRTIGGTIGSLIVAVGALIVIVKLWHARRSGRNWAEPLSVVDFLSAKRERLARQIRLLQTVAWWYIGPIIVGVNVFFWSNSPSRVVSVIYLIATLILGGFIWWLNQRAVRTDLKPTLDKIDDVIRQVVPNGGDKGRTAAIMTPPQSFSADTPTARQELMEIGPTLARTGQLRRWAEGVVFVGIWIVLGWSLALDANAYLLLGVPLTAVFQKLGRQQPLRALWVREAPAFGKGAIVPAVVIGVLPAYWLVESIADRQWIISTWMGAALCGAVAAGYAIWNFRREDVRPFLMCQLTAGTIGIALMIAARMANAVGRAPLPLAGVRDFLLYFPVCFVLEEVSFRGALDSHLHRTGEHYRYASALLGAALWGIWHLPTLPAGSRGLESTLALVIVHSLIGVPLAIYWRKSGNLAVTSFTHALIDGVRNALRIMG